jgi:RsiW-degrading membrane proteinase PrsW (M82 family)
MPLSNYFLIIIFFFLTAIFPVIFWIIFFSYQDRKEPEPKTHIIKVFLWGILMAFLTILIKKLLIVILPESDNLAYHNKYLAFYAEASVAGYFGLKGLFAFSIIEELLKFSALKILIYKKKVFNQIIDGVVYGTTIALGFAFVENSLYFFDFLEKLPQQKFFMLLSLRGIASVLLHVSATGIIGYYLGKAKFNPKKKYRLIITGLVLGSLLHAVFNLSLQIIFPFNLIAFIVLAIGFVYLLKELKKKKSKIIWWPQ